MKHCLGEVIANQFPNGDVPPSGSLLRSYLLSTLSGACLILELLGTSNSVPKIIVVLAHVRTLSVLADEAP